MAEPLPRDDKPVVVQLRAGASNRLAIEVAARFARALNQAFEGHFIEDEELLSLAGLPFAREVSVSGRRTRTLTRLDVHRELRIQSRALHRDLELVARSAGLRWHFRVVRQAQAAALKAASRTARILVLAEPLSGSERRPAGAIAACLDEVEGCVVVGSGARHVSGPVVILLDRPASLATMAHLAESWIGAGDEGVYVLACGEAVQGEARLPGAVREKFAAGRKVTILHLEDTASGGTISALVRRTGAGLLIARAGDRCTPDEASLARLAGALECPLLILRGEAGRAPQAPPAPGATSSRT